MPITAGGKIGKKVKTLLSVLRVQLDWPKSTAAHNAPGWAWVVASNDPRFSIPQMAGAPIFHSVGEPNSSFRSRLKCRGCAQCARLGVGSWAVDFGQSSFTLKTLKSVLTFFPILPPAVMGTRCPAV